jgi:hypothetical protein
VVQGPERLCLRGHRVPSVRCFGASVLRFGGSAQCFSEPGV